jgi:hypothetical protein
MASYSLLPTDYAIVKNNGSPFDEGSVSVSLQGQPGDERIHLFAGDDFLDIALEQWPLIIEAVDKLLNKGAEKLVSTEVPLELLRKMDFVPYQAHKVVGGCAAALDYAFTWTASPQGFEYWSQRCKGKEPLSNQDKALLQSWIDAAKHYGL